MKKLKAISIVLGVVVAIVVAIGIIFSTIYEDKVKVYIIEQVNNSVNTKIDVKEISFSVFKKFPYASLEFNQVSAEDVVKHENILDRGTLFSAQSIYLQFNIFDILKENYTIKKVQVEDGMVNIKIDKLGNDNYHFWKESGNTKNQLSIELENLTFKDVSFYILNDYKGVDMDIEAVGLSLSGNFSKDEFTMKTQANLLVNQINDKGETLLKNKNILINTSLAVNQTTKLYQIKQGKISIEQLNFSLAGNIINKEVGVNLNLKSEGQNIEIEELFSLLPPKQREALSAYKTKGKIAYTSKIIGELSIKHTPGFNAEFNIENGIITERSSNKSLTNLHLTGSFTNGKGYTMNTAQLILDSVNADFGAGHIAGNYVITNFSNPYIEFDSKANIDIATAKEFFKLNRLESASGNLEINLKYKGQVQELNNIKAQELRKLSASGTATLSNTNLTLINNSKVITDIDGSFKFNNNDVQIDALNFKLNKGYFELDGKLKNLLAFLFVEGEKLVVNTTFYSSKLILDELLSQKKKSNTSSDYTLELPSNIALKFKAKIDTFQFRRFTASNFNGYIQLKNKKLTATNVSFNAMKGKVEGNITVDDTKKNEILITSEVTTREIDVYELFYQFEDFGQKEIKAENLKGKTTTSIQFASVWDKHLNIKKDNIYVLSTINIKDGELINYTPVLALSKYIEVEELEHIKFSSLITQIEIKNQIVSIPKTAIKSNALDLTFSGTHTFDNAIDYRFQVLMSDVLWRKAKTNKKENSEFGYIEDDGLGKTSLFLTMSGTIDNYKISYDTKGLKQSWKEDLKKEKTTIKTVLNKEFGWFKKDDNLEKEKTKDDGFEIEWEEAEEGKKTKDNEENSTKKKNSSAPPKKKKRLGKFIDKIANSDEEEYENFDDF